MSRIKLLKKIRKVVLILFLVSLAGYFGYRYGSSGRRLNFAVRKTNKSSVDLSQFWLVWNRLERKYLDKKALKSEEMVQGAISGMVSSLGDPYTVYLPPEDNEISQENLTGSFGGVGIRLGYKDSQLAVISPLKQTPAETAGVKAGDYILKIIDENNGIDQATQDITLPEAVKLIRGEIGDKVTLTLSRESRPEPFDVEITRGEIKIPALETSWKEKDGKKFGYIHLLQFSQRMTKEWDKWVKEIKGSADDSNFGGIVLDLRNNPGGYLNGAVHVAGDFLPFGKTVVWQENYQGIEEEFNVQRNGELIDLPMVVLVNGGSASASEILAGALKHYEKAKLVGETTFGKGTIQEPEQLPNKAGLHITTARWLLPDQTSINEKGLQPDIVVELPEEEDGEDVKIEEEKDLILERGLKELSSNK